MGKPVNSHYVSMMRRKSRLQYHYAIRRVVNNNTRLRNNKMGDAVSENEDRVLWDEVRKITRANKDLTISMDTYDTVEDISKLFADKYDMLYNQVSYNKQDMSKLPADINAFINNECVNNAKLIKGIL